jgi:HD-GYP domain-containing protein (c-di-GMP phosphodiesterase class II)
MSFRTRAFLLSFLPCALLLLIGFWATSVLVRSTVRASVRESLRQNQLTFVRQRASADLQNNRFLSIAGENAALKAGLQLLLDNRNDPGARRTIEDQLQDLCTRMGFDFLLVSDAAAKPLAAVLQQGAKINAFDPSSLHAPEKGLMSLGGTVFEVASTPVDQGDENLGFLFVGQRFDLSAFTTPVVLSRHGQMIDSTLGGRPADLAAAMTACTGECDIRLNGQSFLSLPLQDVSRADGFELRSLQNIDAAASPAQVLLNRVFIAVFVCALVVMWIFAMASAKSIVRPLTQVVGHLRAARDTGLLPEFNNQISAVREIRELTASFNIAAVSVRDGRDNLQRAYLGFVESLASALDARDPYTAGHSRRVSDISCAVATRLGVTREPLEEIRIGALLHDIGKIGVPDHVLQKPSRLTMEEFNLVKQHPEIGRRILEEVSGFAPYLDAVELHHENWDGTGYPHGQRGEQTPLAARIIHVADAYDAMTTDRPYRRGMSDDQARGILATCAGTQFDPHVAHAFLFTEVREAAEPKRAFASTAETA